MKHSLLLLIFASPAIAMNPSTALVRTAKGYNLHMGSIEHKVKSHDIDSRLKSLDEKQLNRLATMGGLKTYKMSNGDYRVEIGGGLKGGGVLGAKIGAYIGKGAVYVLGHGTIVVASALTGWGCIATFLSLEATFAAKIELASNVGAVAGGLAGGVATGPV